MLRFIDWRIINDVINYRKWFLTKQIGDAIEKLCHSHNALQDENARLKEVISSLEQKLKVSQQGFEEALKSYQKQCSFLASQLERIYSIAGEECLQD